MKIAVDRSVIAATCRDGAFERLEWVETGHLAIERRLTSMWPILAPDSRKCGALQTSAPTESSAQQSHNEEQ
jgi:hypothetical protein